MLNTNEITPIPICWETVFGPAIQAASQAMGVWTHGRVTLSLDEVCEMPLGDIESVIPGVNETSTIVILGVAGEVGGQMLLSIDDHAAMKLTSLLLNREPRALEAWGEIERSALMETGNILSSAFLSEMTNLTGVRLFPTPPMILHDYIAGVLEQAVMMQAIESDNVLLARTCFRHLDERVNWNMVFVPSVELLHLLRIVAGAMNAVET